MDVETAEILPQGHYTLYLNNIYLRGWRSIFYLRDIIVNWGKVRGQTCRPTRTHYPDPEPSSVCFFLLNSASLSEKQQIPFPQFFLIVFGLIRSGFESMSYGKVEIKLYKHYKEKKLYLFFVFNAEDFMKIEEEMTWPITSGGLGLKILVARRHMGSTYIYNFII